MHFKNILKELIEGDSNYHEAVGKHLDASVAKRGGGEFKVTEVAGKDLGGHGHEIVDHVNNDSRSSKVEKEPQLDQCCGSESLRERNVSIGQYSFKLVA